MTAIVTPLTPQQSAELKEMATIFEVKLDTEIMPALARRAALWQRVKEELPELTPEQIVGADLARRNDEADRWLQTAAQMYTQARAGQLVLLPWTVPGDPAPIRGVGLIERSKVPQQVAGLGDPWLGIALVSVAFATMAALTAAGFLLVDAGLVIFDKMVDTDRLRVETANELARRSVELSKTDPALAAKYADAAVKAGQGSIMAGANPQGFFSKYIAPGLTAAGVGAGGIGMLLLAWFIFSALGGIGEGWRKFRKRPKTKGK